MKKLLILVLSSFLVLAACGSNDDNKKEDKSHETRENEDNNKKSDANKDESYEVANNEDEQSQQDIQSQEEQQQEQGNQEQQQVKEEKGNQEQQEQQSITTPAEAESIVHDHYINDLNATENQVYDFKTSIDRSNEKEFLVEYTTEDAVGTPLPSAAIVDKETGEVIDKFNDMTEEQEQEFEEYQKESPKYITD